MSPAGMGGQGLLLGVPREAVGRLEAEPAAGAQRRVQRGHGALLGEAGLAAATLRARIPQELLEGADPARELLVAWIADEDDLARAHWFLGDDASLELPEPALAAMADGVFRANSVIREFWIDRGDSAGADETESWRTLLPGDRVVIPAGARWWSANHFALKRG